MPERRLWDRGEIIRAIELYCRTRFGRIHSRNPEIIELASRLHRTPNSVALKMTNFASLDPTLDRSGMKNTSKLDRDVWDEFFSDPDTFLMMAASLDTDYTFIEPETPEYASLREGEDIRIIAKARKNQDFFRKMILSSYNNKCCITGIQIPEVLIASHIIPWAKNKRLRMDPRNGLCLNTLHDRAFENGLIAFDDDYTLLLSDRVKKLSYPIFDSYDGRKIALPDRFLPSKELLKLHRTERFQQ